MTLLQKSRRLLAAAVIGLLLGWVVSKACVGQVPGTLREEIMDMEVHSAWIYDDLPRAFAQAREASKPLLVVFRCVP